MVPIEVSQLSFPSLLCHSHVKKWEYLNHWITTQGEIGALNMSAHSIPQSTPWAKLSSRKGVKSSLSDLLQISILSQQILSPPRTAYIQALPASPPACLPSLSTFSYLILRPLVSGSSNYPIPIPPSTNLHTT